MAAEVITYLFTHYPVCMPTYAAEEQQPQQLYQILGLRLCTVEGLYLV